MFAVRIASFECDVCAKLFIKKERLSKHQSVHFIDRNFICAICNANFKTKYQLNRHLQYNRQNADYICDQCGKRFKTSAEIERHQVVHAIDRKYRCELCNSTFKSEVHLKKHKRSVHETNGNVGYICDKCNRSYRDKSTFITHFHEKHTNLFSISNHICTICASIYATQMHLSRHMRVVHRKGAMVTCDICDKSYPQREYSKHFESVHRITNIKCELCNKMFKNNVQFKCHRRRTHNDERKCDRCEQLFKSSNGLLYHIITQHEEDARIVALFDCDQCDQLFIEKQTRKRHIDSVHSTNLHKCKCDLCGKYYKSAFLYRKHQLNVHRTKTLQCDRCEKLFRAQTSLVRHVKMCHSSNA